MFGFYFVLRERIATYLYSKEKRPAEKGEVEEVEGIQGVVIRLMCSEVFVKKSQASADERQYKPWGVTWYHGKYDCEKKGVHEYYPQGYYFDQRFDGFYRIPYAKDGEEIYPHEAG